MGRQSHFDRVRGLVSGQSGIPEAEITLETRLVEDLGMDGDDGDDFLAAFADEFGVDMRAMAPLNYFGDEGIGPPVPSLIPLAVLLSPRFRAWVVHASRGRRRLTVRDLVASARARRWLTPPRRPTAHGSAWPGIAALATCAGLGVWGLAREPLAAFAALVLAVMLGLRLQRDLAALRRLAAAAGFEERALGPEINAED